jgi:hypothetical protein
MRGKMPKINIDDKIYALKDALDFKEYQMEMIVTKIERVKLLGRNRYANLYVGHTTADDRYEASYYSTIETGKRVIHLCSHLKWNITSGIWKGKRNMPKYGIKVKLERGIGNNYILTILAKSHITKIREYLAQFNDLHHGGDGLNWPFDGTIYLYNRDRASLNYLFEVGSAGYRDLLHRWSIVKIVDPYIILNCVGYNAADDCRL